MMDGLGRRVAVVFGAAIMCIATILQTASHSVGMFIGARYVHPHSQWSMTVSAHSHTTDNRFLIGFGLTFAAAAAPVLVTEIAYPTHRAPATSLYNTLWCVDPFAPCSFSRRSVRMPT